jgi:hypothetical protein
MQEKIKQLYTASVRDPEHANAYHSLVFDIESFAQRLVFRCATTAKVAQAEGKDAYAEIMQKYGAEIEEVPTQLNFHKVGEDIPLVEADDTIHPEVAKSLLERITR